MGPLLDCTPLRSAYQKFSRDATRPFLHARHLRILDGQGIAVAVQGTVEVDVVDPPLQVDHYLEVLHEAPSQVGAQEVHGLRQLRQQRRGCARRPDG